MQRLIDSMRAEVARGAHGKAQLTPFGAVLHRVIPYWVKSSNPNPVVRAFEWPRFQFDRNSAHIMNGLARLYGAEEEQECVIESRDNSVCTAHKDVQISGDVAEIHDPVWGRGENVSGVQAAIVEALLKNGSMTVGEIESSILNKRNVQEEIMHLISRGILARTSHKTGSSTERSWV
jgi:hypothetical protein